MKMVIIAVVALLVIGGGGAGAYFYLMPQDGEDVVAEAEIKEEEAVETQAAFVELDPFMLSVVGKNKTHYNLGMAVVIQVKSEADVELVNNLKPKFVHYFLEELYDSMGKEVDKDYSHSASLSTVQGKLIKIAQNIAGEGKIEDVLIQLMSKQPV